MNISFAWEDGFPKGFGHTSIAFLKRCPGFTDAKNGDHTAAQFVVNLCVKHNRLIDLRNQYPDAVLLPVIGNNRIPLALAQAIGLPVCTSVKLVHILARKALRAVQRLLHRPVFVGYIESNTTYIIVDDVITQGGTVAALRDFVLGHGGKVVAVVALAFAFGSHILAPMRKHIVRLMVKFGLLVIQMLQVNGIASEVYELTNSQIKYLLRFSSIKNIEKKMQAYKLTA